MTANVAVIAAHPRRGQHTLNRRCAAHNPGVRRGDGRRCHNAWSATHQPRARHSGVSSGSSPNTRDSRSSVKELKSAGEFAPVWLGNDEAAFATTDALARLWFQLAFGRGWGRRLGWRLLTAADDQDEAPPAGPGQASRTFR